MTCQTMSDVLSDDVRQEDSMRLDSRGRRIGARPARLGQLALASAPGEKPKLRPCLAEGHHHLILSTRACRLCTRGRKQNATVDPIHGYATGFGRASWIRPDGT